jgi:DNA-binding NarL/FixJ family response regulator
MSNHMQPVTVAIADTDHNRRAGYERFLQNENGIMLLSDEISKTGSSVDRTFMDRRSRSRANITISEDEIARIKRLNPFVLLVDMNLCTDEDSAMLLSLRRECPDAMVVLLVDDSIQDDQLLKILKIGARGYMKYGTVQMQLSKAIHAVGRGEAWVSRKMLGGLMSHILKQ